MWIACLFPLLALAGGEPAPQAGDPPQPIFWRQAMFSIPFHVDRAQNPAQEAVEVQLWVSPDRGKRWDNWRQAAPKKGHFLFRAGVDGEYWFDVLTRDRSGQVRPAGAHSAKLVVVVDTTPPKVQVTARRGEDGQITASYRIDEPYLRTDTLAIDYRFGPGGPWQPVPIGPTALQSNGAAHTGEVSWPSPIYAAGAMDIRLRINDMAGNAGVGHAALNFPADGRTVAGAAAGGFTTPKVIQNNFANGSPPSQYAIAAPPGPPPGMNVAGNNGAPVSPFDRAGANPWQAPAAAQSPWPTENGPAASAETPANGPRGHVDLHVNVPAPPANELVAVGESGGSPGAAGGPAAAANGPGAFQEFKPSSPAPAIGSAAGGAANPFDAFASGSREKTPGAAMNGAGANGAGASGTATNGPATNGAGANGAGGVPEKLRWINSRVFQLAYDTKTLSAGNNVPVELWGTRDGGKTWQSFGKDPKGQSPMLVTVPEEGVYGFQMLLQSGSGAARPPLSGEVPRIWIGIDLTQPTGRITQAKQGTGRDADKLVVSWQARDDRALAAKPITLSYSDRAGGPWTTIAADQEDSGNYSWKLNSRLPQRVYLRLEVRDAAGNMGVYEKPEPVALDLTGVVVPLGELPPP